MQCWRVRLDVTKPARKLAVVTMFSVIPTTQTKQSPRPEDVADLEAQSPVLLLCVLPHSICLFISRMEDLSGDPLGYFLF